MLGNTLVTIQTGEAGKQVNRLYVTDGVDIAKEFYLALLVNRAETAGSAACTWAQLGLPPGPAAVRDLWAHAALGNFSDSFTAQALPPHASMLVTVAHAQRAK
jgi:hypothetical protein